jgi:NADH-quinone oxidoreductase subunit L
MENIIAIIPLFPLVGLLIIQLFNNKSEVAIYRTAMLSVFGVIGSLVVLTVLWIQNGMGSVSFDGPILYHSKESEFGVNFFLDTFGWVYLMVSTIITSLIFKFSKTYVHREKGFKRFFSNMMFFYTGLLVVLLAGNLEILFIGWEILGVTSFFLIGFYRERYLPVKNALKVVSVYRIADIALLCGIWICHHYYGHSIHFSTLETLKGSTQIHIMNESFYHFMIPAVFLLAAMVKSAQLPFSSWVPRAMEGPTTSSAIFYGSLSVHIGVFLLIRTFPFWEENFVLRTMMGSIGVLTAIIATLTARVQPSVKTQIGYSSIAQIGLMFVWVSMGWFWLAIIHFACNAFLRAYQLLVSPSILSYRIHNQFFDFVKPKMQSTEGFFNKLKLTVYVLGLKEFNLDTMMFRFLWQPLKKAGNIFSFLNIQTTYVLAIPPFLLGFYAVFNQEFIPKVILSYLPEAFALFGLVFILKAFVERKSALNAWVLIMVNQLYQSLTFMFNEEFDMQQVGLFLSGILISTLIGIYSINKLRIQGENVSLNRFHGHSFEHPRLAFVFALACLGLSGFPITPTFIGEDLMLGHIHENQYPLLAMLILNIILDGLVIFRIYSRLFLGPHTKGYHEVAYRSS